MLRAMTPPLIVLRARALSPSIRSLADRLARHGPVVAALDPAGAEAADARSDALPVIAMTEEATGIDGLPPDWRWRCGELALAVAAARRPGHDRLLLVEDDVHLPPGAADALVPALIAAGAEAAAVRLGPRPAPPRWSRGLEKLGLDPGWGALFPLVWASRGMVRAMERLRREALARGLGGRLNDEAMLVGAVQRTGARWAAMEALAPGLFGPGFAVNPPHLAEAVARDPHILHPVIDGEEALARLAAKRPGYGRHRLRRVLKAAGPGLRARLDAALEGG